MLSSGLPFRPSPATSVPYPSPYGAHLPFGASTSRPANLICELITDSLSNPVYHLLSVSLSQRHRVLYGDISLAIHTFLLMPPVHMRILLHCSAMILLYCSATVLLLMVPIPLPVLVLSLRHLYLPASCSTTLLLMALRLFLLSKKNISRFSPSKLRI